MITAKIKILEELVSAIGDHRRTGKRIVFTNGCFDILHSGHALYLEAAKAEGDILVVGVNSDASVKRLKGDMRPIISQSERLIMIAALEAVDYVTLFDEDTPLNLILSIIPNVLVKGGDWQISEIVGSDIVLAHGGTVKSLIFRDGMSSSTIISRIRETDNGG